MTGTWDKQLELASGGYYKGKVEKNKQRLGLHGMKFEYLFFSYQCD